MRNFNITLRIVRREKSGINALYFNGQIFVQRTDRIVLWVSTLQKEQNMMFQSNEAGVSVIKDEQRAGAVVSWTGIDHLATFV